MTDPTLSHTAPTLDDLWLTEAVRLTEEETGPLDDAEANRRARATGGSFLQRLLLRAHLLGQRDGLLEARRHWRQGANLSLWLLLLLALLSGAGLGFGALGDGLRPVNVFWALGSLLGLHLLTLLLWLLGFLGGGRHASVLGRLWLWLAGKLARDARAVHLGPALIVLLGRQRLVRWGLGMIVHGLWLVALLAALGVVLALLSARSYSFIWETTILGSNTFVRLTQILGVLPGLLGFPTPDVETIRASGNIAQGLEAARQAWAGWLMGVLVVYGLFPRAVLLALCSWQWQRGRHRLTLDLDQPGYVLLRERLMPTSERLGVNDAAPELLPEPVGGNLALASEAAVLVAIELDDSQPWPPVLPERIVDAGVLDDGQQRRRLLEQLTRYPPVRLVIACDPRRSPDRGTLSLIGELARCAGTTRAWLLPAPNGETLDPDRLDDWQQGLDRLGLFHGEHSPLDWLETGHE
ncbi:uncharacterized protein DUF2868 [Pseudomonas duriflava]|uniref:Uncharacterized protein DUF2868 n=1 Tax=Pseudomonas duriflava TaxID=459528 RepID=A0A562Q6D9_9PSED|nr:DUF2868 domain-containing protein [Pseudomonas duriflava]TWI52299.1 uncharacterized protein DUF2868 [Pseudomonas duriflava]